MQHGHVTLDPGLRSGPSASASPTRRTEHDPSSDAGAIPDLLLMLIQ
jgi:hypothetical protein